MRTKVAMKMYLQIKVSAKAAKMEMRAVSTKVVVGTCLLMKVSVKAAKTEIKTVSAKVSKMEIRIIFQI